MSKDKTIKRILIITLFSLFNILMITLFSLFVVASTNAEIIERIEIVHPSYYATDGMPGSTLIPLELYAYYYNGNKRNITCRKCTVWNATVISSGDDKDVQIVNGVLYYRLDTCGFGYDMCLKTVIVNATYIEDDRVYTDSIRLWFRQRGY